MSRRETLSKIWKTGCVLASVCALIVIFVQVSELTRVRETANDIRPTPFALVLGAGLKSPWVASDTLRDRMASAIELYQQHKVTKLLLSGDDGRYRGDEVDVMKKLALDAGVAPGDLVIDGQGYRTYESCKRAVTVFDIKQSVIVTQRFHLGRALYLCSRLGMTDVQGLVADKQSYGVRIVEFTIRDLLASFKAWVDINVSIPLPPIPQT